MEPIGTVVTDLNDAITGFSDMKTAPRTAKAARSGATASFANLIQIRAASSATSSTS